MSIEKIKSGKYRAVIYRHGKKIGRSPSFSKRKDAVEWETTYKQKLIDLSLGKCRENESILEAFSEFAKELKEKDRDYRRQVLRVVAEHIDHHEMTMVGEFLPEFIEGYKRRIDGKPKTISNYVGHLKLFGGFLHKNGYLSANPGLGIKKPTVVNDKLETLSLDELKLFIGKAYDRHPNSAPLFNLLALTGMRVLEAATLQWREVDFETGLIRLRNKRHIKIKDEPFVCKHNSERDIPISSSCKKFLEGLPRKSNFVIVNSNGTPFFNNVNRDFNDVVRSIRDDELEKGVRGDLLNPKLELTPHDLRHAWISHALENGLSPEAVAKYCGHKSSFFTMKVYGHFVPKKGRTEEDSGKFLSFDED